MELQNKKRYSLSLDSNTQYKTKKKDAYMKSKMWKNFKMEITILSKITHSYFLT